MVPVPTFEKVTVTVPVPAPYLLLLLNYLLVLMGGPAFYGFFLRNGYIQIQ